MKAHSQDFKDKIKELGREFDSKITYTQNGTTIELGNEELNSITPHYEGAILKSVMKQLDIDSNVDIPIGTEVNYQLGLKLRNGYNLLNRELCQENKALTWASGILWDETGALTSDYIPTIKGDKIIMTYEAQIMFYNINKEYLGCLQGGKTTIAKQTGWSDTYFTTPNYDDIAFVRVAFRQNYNQGIDLLNANIMINQGTTLLPYEAYGQCDYLDYGNYIVKESEKQEDTNSYRLTCYDKMLYAMKDYEALTDANNEYITYPITIRDYLIALARRLNLTFKNANDTFVNYDKQIKSERYLTEDGASLNYTYRDVLDELSQATASSICISDDDELEIRYINKTEIAPLPIEYQQVEYIESSDHQRINTGIIPTEDTKIDIDFMYLGALSEQTWISLYGERTASDITYFCLFINSSNYKITPNYAGFDPGNNSQTTIAPNVKYNIKTDVGQLYLNGELRSDLSTSNIISGATREIYLFDMNERGTAQDRGGVWRIYRCKFYEGEEVVRDFIPCIRINDNEVGLYDIINNVFYTNQKTNVDTFSNGDKIFDTIDEEYLKDVNVKFDKEKFGAINTINLARADNSDIISKSIPSDLADNLKKSITISNNQILNDDDRGDYIDGILNQLNGLEYYINDFTSTGVCYYDFLDKYNVKVDNKFYNCIMLNDEINIEQGITETIHAEAMEQLDVDYTKTTKTDKIELKTSLIVNKQQGQIESVVGRTTTLEGDYDDLETQIGLLGSRVSQTEVGVQIATSVQQTIINGVPLVRTGIVVINDEGIDVGTTASKVHTKMRNNEFVVGSEDSDEKLAFIGYDESDNTSKAEMDNLYVRKWFVSGSHRREKFEINNKMRTGEFYNE